MLIPFQYQLTHRLELSAEYHACTQATVAARFVKLTDIYVVVLVRWLCRQLLFQSLFPCMRLFHAPTATVAGTPVSSYLVKLSLAVPCMVWLCELMHTLTYTCTLPPLPPLGERIKKINCFPRAPVIQSARLMKMTAMLIEVDTLHRLTFEHTNGMMQQ